MPSFYKICLEEWAREMSKTIPTTRNDILQENLFGNNSILIFGKIKKQGNGKPLFYPHWAESGLKTVEDIWDKKKQ